MMSTSTRSREWMVHCLVQYQMEKIRSGGYGLWLLNVLENGFPGFGSLSDDELRREMQGRGLRAEFDVPDAPVDEDDDADFEDDDEWLDALPAAAKEGNYAV